MLVRTSQIYANGVRVNQLSVLRLINLVSVSKPGFFGVILGISVEQLDLQKVDRLL
jgi:hypothetical protein